MTDADIPFDADFPAAEIDAWRALAEKALKGAPFERLTARTRDGIQIALYSPANTAGAIAGRAAGLRWTVVQRVDHPDPAAASEFARADLEGGADGLELIGAGGARAAGYGLDVNDEGVLAAALKGVQLDGPRLTLAPSGPGVAAAMAFASVAEAAQVDPASIDVAFGLDPLGALAFFGRSRVPIASSMVECAACAHALRERGFRGPFFCADGRIPHNAGATEAQELGYALAAAIAWLRAACDAGFDAAAAAGAVMMALSVDADQFLGVAKMRAARRLWARALEASAIANAPPLRLHAETSLRMMTRLDPWNNMLRTTLAAFAAGIGGADSVTVLPFTLAAGLPDGFARRIARNAQTILIEESNLHRVADPAAGSGHVEALSEALAEQAWAFMQGIEAADAAAALRSGVVQNAVATAAEARAAQIATRAAPITGVSEYAILAEKPAATLDVAPPPPPSFDEPAETAPATPPRRDAAPFEALRDAAAAADPAPTVFIAGVGALAAYGARASWARNLFAAVGIAATGGDGYSNGQDCADAFTAAGGGDVCLCGGDEDLAAKAAPFAAALRAAGARRIWCAGQPGDWEEAARAAGVDQFLFAGIDVLTTLNPA